VSYIHTRYMSLCHANAGNRYEVDVDEKIGKIGIGYFSTVYKGTWRKRVVAIKVLATTTPRKLFTHEIEIWKHLSHPNVLELYGASSASGEPPWFFVSPYCQNGSLVTWLKGMKNGDDVDLLRCMHQVAKGMEYLHRKEVLHGDLKVSFFLFGVGGWFGCSLLMMMLFGVGCECACG
jgi:abelson tyrosine-protein kinase 1